MWTLQKLPLTSKYNRIAICGPMASGKSYAADYLVTHHRYTKMALADKLKAIAYELYGVAGKDGDGRRMYQELGDSLRAFDDDVFTKYTISKIKQFYVNNKIVIDDLRLPKEADILRNAGFFIIAVNTDDETRLRRVDTLYPGVPQARRSHATEVSWSGIVPDATISSAYPHDMVELDILLGAANEPY